MTRLHDRSVALARQAAALIALGVAAPIAGLAGFTSMVYAETVALVALALAGIESAIGLITA